MFKSISLTVFATFLGQALGFFVDILIAKDFGTSWKADAYLLALVIPMMITDLFILGINSAFIPVYMSYRKTENGDRLFTAFTNVTFAFTVAIASAMYFLTPPFIGMISGRFAPEAVSLTITITRLLLVLIVTMPLAAVLSNCLNAHGRFVLPALAKSFNYACMIGALFFLQSSFDIYSLPAGLILGNVAFIAALIFLFNRTGLGYSVDAGVRHQALKEIGLLVLPMVLAAAVNYTNMLVERGMATRLSEGTIASLSYAFKLVNMPVNFLVLGGMSVILPVFSRYAAEKDMANLREMTVKGLRLVCFLLFPVIVGLAVFRSPIVSFLFERGKFSADSTEVTAMAVLFYVFGIMGLSVVTVASRVFYALKDMKTVSVLGVLMIFVNIALIVILSSLLGFIGIPLTFSITSTIHMTVMLMLLGKRLNIDLVTQFFKTLLRYALAAAATAVICAFFASAAAARVDISSGLNLFVYLTLAAVLVSSSYMLISYFLKVEEVGFIFEKGRAFFKRS